jgi:ketosteroid isomerase-like protein
MQACGLVRRIGDEYNQTMTKTVETWVANYRAAWESNDPVQIRALFTDDAVYARVPHDPKAWRGVDAIVEGWLSIQDEPGSTTFEWELLGVAGDLAFVQGASVYSRVTYDNLWVLRLAPDGRVSEFTEWYMARK